MSRNATHLCPRCGTDAVRIGGVNGEDAAYVGHGTMHSVHMLGPFGLLVGAGVALSKFFSSKYACPRCGYKFEH